MRISFFDIEELQIDEYLFYLRDAAIYNYSQTKDGQKYLDNCWRIEQTAPEKDKLKEKYGKGG